MIKSWLFETVKNLEVILIEFSIINQLKTITKICLHTLTAAPASRSITIFTKGLLLINNRKFADEITADSYKICPL